MLFVGFFPQVASGPISKACELLPQIKRPRPIAPEMMSAGFKTLLWGYFMKVVFADRIALYVDEVYLNFPYLSGLNCLVGSIGYSLQIYGDFAGYSLMAVASADCSDSNLSITSSVRISRQA
jgi:D-alanyl-lipoteichoic acid acyltransferase DltB (MBOAT superfamily)